MDKRLAIFVIVALGVALALAAFVAPFASSSPDGLERVAGDHGMLEDVPETPVWDKAPVPDYTAPGVEDPRLATAIAGVVGVVVMFVGSVAIAMVLVRTKRRDQQATRS